MKRTGGVLLAIGLVLVVLAVVAAGLGFTRFMDSMDRIRSGEVVQGQGSVTLEKGKAYQIWQDTSTSGFVDCTVTAPSGAEVAQSPSTASVTLSANDDEYFLRSTFTAGEDGRHQLSCDESGSDGHRVTVSPKIDVPGTMTWLFVGIGGILGGLLGGALILLGAVLFLVGRSKLKASTR